jgi:hypothetical protein
MSMKGLRHGLRGARPCIPAVKLKGQERVRSAAEDWGELLQLARTAGFRSGKNSFGYVRDNGFAGITQHSPEVDPTKTFLPSKLSRHPGRTLDKKRRNVRPIGGVSEAQSTARSA